MWLFFGVGGKREREFKRGCMASQESSISTFWNTDLDKLMATSKISEKMGLRFSHVHDRKYPFYW
jgi:hypothetical protein